MSWAIWGSTGVTDGSDGGGLIARAGGVRWFVPVRGVLEVLRAPAIARVPGAPASVIGVVNHRGRVLPVADPVRALGLPGAGGGSSEVVVVEGKGRRFGIAVDDVLELASSPRTGLATMDIDAVAAAIFD